MPPRFSFNTDLTSSVNAPYITALGDMKKTKLDSSWSWCEREREPLPCSFGPACSQWDMA